MRKPEMLAIDLDGTLLDSDKNISERSARVLRQCAERGIIIAFATARSRQSCVRIMKQYAPDVMIADGGAAAHIGEKEVYRRVMPAPAADAIIADCKAAGAYHITADAVDGYYTNFDDPGFYLDYEHSVFNDFSAPLGLDMYKICAEHSDTGLLRDIAKKYPNIKMYKFTGDDWVCFMHAEASKWLAVRAVAETCGADVKNVVAFGDDHVDVEMLRGCGAGVATANAIPEVVAAADHVALSNDEDGAAVWIEQNILAG